MSAELGLIAGILLAALAVYAVARPLGKVSSSSLEDDTALADLLAQREAAYQVIRDLDSDYGQERLSEDDYRPLRVRALAQAAEVVAHIDAYQALRERTAHAAAIQSQPVSVPVGAATCPRCGVLHEDEDAFCRKCGEALAKRAPLA